MRPPSLFEYVEQLQLARIAALCGDWDAALRHADRAADEVFYAQQLQLATPAGRALADELFAGDPAWCLIHEALDRICGEAAK
jgi:hypothetical protein